MNTDKTNGTDGNGMPNLGLVPSELRKWLARAGGGDIGEPWPELFLTATSREVSLKCLEWMQKVTYGAPMILTAICVWSDRGPIRVICDEGKN